MSLKCRNETLLAMALLVSTTGIEAHASFVRSVSSLGKIQPLLISIGGDPNNPYGGVFDSPDSSLTAVNGTLYGTTQPLGGANNSGTIFAYNPATAIGQTLVNFHYSDGGNPSDLLNVNGTLYGTTAFGGANNGGTIFAYAPPAGSVRTLTSLPSSNLFEIPTAGLTDVNGTLYGTTPVGGSKNGGTLFAYSPGSQNLQILASFTGGDGATPSAGSRLTDVNGTLYGTTYSGGSKGGGTIFAYNLSSQSLNSVANFPINATAGSPNGGLTNVNGTLYGTTQGGPSGDGTLFAYSPTSKSLKTLITFNGTNGANPSPGLTALDGTLYGTTAYGGASHAGTLFSYTPSLEGSSGGLNTLASFNGSNGFAPLAGVTSLDGTLYGVTAGGPGDGGTLYAYTPKLSINQDRNSNLGNQITRFAQLIHTQPVPNLRSARNDSGFFAKAGTVIMRGVLDINNQVTSILNDPGQSYQDLYYSATTLHKNAVQAIDAAQSAYSSGNATMAKFWYNRATTELQRQDVADQEITKLYTGLANTAYNFVEPIYAGSKIAGTAVCGALTGGTAILACHAAADALSSGTVFMINAANGNTSSAADKALSDLAVNAILGEIGNAKILSVAAGKTSLKTVVDNLLSKAGFEQQLAKDMADKAGQFGVTTTVLNSLDIPAQLGALRNAIASYTGVSSTSSQATQSSSSLSATGSPLAVQTTGNGDLGGQTLNAGADILYNDYHVSGSGKIVAGKIINFGTISDPRGKLNVISNVTNYNSVTVSDGQLDVSGNLKNLGTLQVSNSTMNVGGNFYNSGAFVDSPSTSNFHNVYIGSGGYFSIQGDGRVNVSGSFMNNSTQKTLWDTKNAILAFSGSGNHVLSVVGRDLGAVMAGYNNNFALGNLDLSELSGALTLSIGNPRFIDALYLKSISGLKINGQSITNIFGDGLNIYYMEGLSVNGYLDGSTYLLANGGYLIPISNERVPEPSSFAVLLTGAVLTLWAWRKGGARRP